MGVGLHNKRSSIYSESVSFRGHSKIPSKLQLLEIFHGSSLPESWANLVSLRRFTFRAKNSDILLPSIFGGMRNLEHLDVCTNSYGDMLQDLVFDTRIQLCRTWFCGQR
ncbi:hypothetical protein BSKO_03489 [Bryopsis sp. KO-2023]|nr:hypothetical protein BSKO_03489 [Bryopsis sp. KO-2023]